MHKRWNRMLWAVVVLGGCQGPALWQPYSYPGYGPPGTAGGGYLSPPSAYLPAQPAGRAQTPDVSPAGSASASDAYAPEVADSGTAPER